MPFPLVSVVIPSYNSARYVGAAIESVLEQAGVPVEVLVVDDGSKDNTAEVVAAYGSPVRYLHQANAGVSVARNHGIQESRAKYVAFLDADDTWMPNKLTRQLDALERTPKARLCYAAYVRVDDQLEPLGIQRSSRRGTALEDLLLRGNVVGSICTVIVERALLETVGGFDPALSQCADWDMWVRLARHTEFLYVDEPLVTYRQHGSNMSHNVPLLETDSFLVLGKGLEHPENPAHLREQKRRIFGRNWIVLAGCYFHARRYRDFARCSVQALLADPRHTAQLASFPVRGLRRFVRSTRGHA